MPPEETERERSHAPARACAGGGQGLRLMPAGTERGSSSPVRGEKVRLARRRILQGFYDRPEIKDLLARSILRTLGLDV